MTTWLVLYYVHGFFVSLLESKRFLEYLDAKYGSTKDSYDPSFCLPMAVIGGFIWPAIILKGTYDYPIPSK